MNIALPAGTFGLLSVYFMLLHVNYPPSRLTYLLTLTLTLVAYKLSTNAHMPTVTYLTTIDRYEWWNAAIVLGSVFETAGLAAHLHFYDSQNSVSDPLPPVASVVDFVAQGIFGVVWLLVNAWFLYHVYVARRQRNEVRAEHGQGVQPLPLREASVRALHALNGRAPTFSSIVSADSDRARLR